MSEKRQTLDKWLIKSKKAKLSNPEAVISSGFPSSAVVDRTEETRKVRDSRAGCSNDPFILEVEPQHSVTEVSDEKDSFTPNTINISDSVIQFRPSPQFQFPRTKGRSCHQSWFGTFKWLHYNSEKDAVFCFTCMQGVKLQQLSHFKGIETTFFQTGYSNWKKAIDKFRAHEKSAFHSKCSHYIIQKEKGVPVFTLISQQTSQEQKLAYAALKTIVSSIRFLARSGVALRGAGTETGNLKLLLEERCEDVPGFQKWLNRRDNFLSADIQNEILQIMAHNLQRNLVDEVRGSDYFGLIADGTTDTNGHEQFSVCLRYVEKDTLLVKESFLGMYSLLNSKADTLFIAIKDMFQRLGIDVSRLRGHCFDGATNMAGKFNGVQSKLLNYQPKSIFIHCANHSLDLALQELGRQSSMVSDALGVVRNVSNIILESSKRKNIYDAIEQHPLTSDISNLKQESGKLLPLCPTRWAVRTKSMKRFVANYRRIMDTINEILMEPNSVRSERRSALRGHLILMENFDTLFGIKVAVAVFTPCEELATALQKAGYTAAGAKRAAECLINVLSEKRCSEAFSKIWEEAETYALRLKLKPPSKHRTIMPPKRYEQTKTPTLSADLQLDVKTIMRRSYYQVLDCLISELKRRFDQKGMDSLINLESILLQSAKKQFLTLDQLEEKLGTYKEDFDLQRLSAQLSLLPTEDFKDDVTVEKIAEKFRNESKTVCSLFDEVIRLLTIWLVVPASSASSERSFSALRRVKTYLRTNMTQKRLTHLLLLHVHSDRVKHLKLEDIMKEFISSTAERKNTFGFQYL